MADDQHHMIFSHKECETVIVLGAGASKHAGVPLLGEFRDKLREFISCASSLTSEEQQILQYADCLFERYHCPDGNVETLFSTISAGTGLGSHDACNDRDTLSRAIALIVEMSLDSQRSQHFARLIGSIAAMDKLNADKAIAVPRAGDNDGSMLIYPVPAICVTFNWDSALDLEFSLGFPQEPNPIIFLSWLSGRERFSFDFCGEIDRKADIKFLRCLRPHGSMTWGVCQSCHRTRVFSHSETRAAGSFFQTITNAFCGWHAGEEHSQLQPCIVAPTWDKRTDTPDLQGIWAATAQALMQCENLLVIGFSLPPSDANVNSMFRFALGRNRTLQKVMVVDPSPESKDNWQTLVNDTQPALRSWEYVDQPFDENSLRQIETWLQPRCGCCDRVVRQ